MLFFNNNVPLLSIGHKLVPTGGMARQQQQQLFLRTKVSIDAKLIDGPPEKNLKGKESNITDLRNFSVALTKMN